MSEEEKEVEEKSESGNSHSGQNESKSIYLVPFPKVIFLYPTFITCVLAAIWMTIFSPTEIVEVDGEQVVAATQSGVGWTAVFLCVMTLNMVVLAFDFPRATSLTVFFLVSAAVLGAVLLFTWQPKVLPALEGFVMMIRPIANATFFWCLTLMYSILFGLVFISVKFDYWEIRQNELLHHHGVMSDLKRFAAPSLRIDKEINDVFEYVLLGSGRLIVHASNERRAIVLDNVLFINRKEQRITQMLSAIKVDIRNHGHS